MSELITKKENKINKIGIELEGYFEELPQTEGQFKTDSSVHITNRANRSCTGDCRNGENCDCYDDCECESCYLCELCEERVDNCTCNECLMCVNCDNLMSDCSCKVPQSDNCNTRTCKEDKRCALCKEEFKLDEDRETYSDCGDYGRTMCNRECSCECGCECDCVNERVGEYVSLPLKVEQVEKWIENSYPTETNSSCGGHIHISMKSCADYMELMNRSFYKFYLTRMESWGKKMKLPSSSAFYTRLKGKEFCFKKFQPELQRNMRGHYDSPRYTHINFCYNVDQRHTVEFRMLPCFEDKNLMISATIETMDIINDYLNSKKKPRRAFLKVAL